MSVDSATRGWCALLVGVALVGCGHAETEGAASVSALNRTVQSLRAQNAAYARQVEELENRLFILSDKLESKRSGSERVSAPAPLPKVMLHPAERTAPQTVIEEPTDQSGEATVEYAGEAAKSGSKRPLLRLYGDDVPLMSAAAEREPEPRRLLVVPTESRRETHPSTASSVGSGLALYKRSLESLRAGRHVDAVAGFREFIKQHPNHDFADNAQYWLGECYYDQKDYPMAMREFRRVVEKYASGNKVADALLKIGFAHLALGSTGVGRQTLEQVVRSYPRQEAAVLANAKLDELGRTASKTEPLSRSVQEAP